MTHRTEAEKPASHEHLDTLENVLRDTPTPLRTRRWLLERAATGAAAAGAVGLMDPIGSAFAHARRHGGHDAAKTVGTIAVTAEAFAVTYLTQVLANPPAGTPANVAEIIKAADLEEFRHYEFLRKSGFRPLTQKFYLPDALFGPTATHVAAVIEVAEELFINAYLIGITTFAAGGNPTLARYAGEILGVEAEHRALARLAQGKTPPNNRAFESYRYHKLTDVVVALESAGVGFGKPTPKGGPLYRFHGVGNATSGVAVEELNPR